MFVLFSFFILQKSAGNKKNKNDCSKANGNSTTKSKSNSHTGKISLYYSCSFASCLKNTNNLLISVGLGWNDNNVKLLLSVRLEREKDFLKPFARKKTLWEEVKNTVNEEGDLNLKTTDCEIKYNNLVYSYRVNKQKQVQSGESSIKWPFFQIMDAVLGYKASSYPDEKLLADTSQESSNAKRPQQGKKSTKNESNSESDESSSESDKENKRAGKVYIIRFLD